MAIGLVKKTQIKIYVKSKAKVATLISEKALTAILAKY